MFYDDYADLERQLAEAKKLAVEFLAAFDAVEPAINGSFQFQALHGMYYTGPTYGKELEALRSIIAPPQPEKPSTTA